MHPLCRHTSVTRALILPLALAIATLAVACGGDDGAGAPVTGEPAPTLPPPATVPVPAVDGRELVLTSIEGHTLVEGTTVRLTFDGGTLGANAGCNQIFGGYTFDGERLMVDQLGTTEMACEPARMAQDRWLTDILTLEPRVSVDGDVVTFRVAGGATLEFMDRELAEPDLPLVGTRWVVDGLRTQDAMSSVPDGVVASITFESDRALVEAGCNRGSAEVEIGDDVITFGPLALTRMMCEEGPMEVEALVSALLQGDVNYSIAHDRLTLDSPDSDTSTDDEPAEMGGIGLTLVAETD